MAEAGDDLLDITEDRALVMVNHQSTADVPMMFHSLQHKGNVLKHIMWVQDLIFKYTDFGWVSYLHGDFFLQQVGYEYRVGSYSFSMKMVQ